MKGYSNQRGKHAGGLEKILIISASKITAVNYDYSKDCFTEIVLDEGCEFEEYSFLKDSACYTETMVIENGTAMVKHKLEFSLPQMDSDSRKASEHLQKNTSESFASIVTTPNGISYLLGMSPHWSASFPLKLIKNEATSNHKPLDFNGEKLTLESVDDTKASIFCGMIRN